jgi:hypothetical protein
LVVGERFGKAVRTPARDTMLAAASVSLGRGWAFALHEALDHSPKWEPAGDAPHRRSPA